MPDARQISTRRALHQVAEHVLGAAQYQRTGRIRLQVVPGGYATVDALDDGARPAVIGAALLADGAGPPLPLAALRTLRACGAALGVAPGMPDDLYLASAFDPDAPLDLDPESARLLCDWLALGDGALRSFAAELAAPVEPVLWPEHFDVAITVDAVNYGASPGDDAMPDPYLYIGPHGGAPDASPFWNAPFGAARAATEIPGVPDAVAFFREGRARLTTARPS